MSMRWCVDEIRTHEVWVDTNIIGTYTNYTLQINHTYSGYENTTRSRIYQWVCKTGNTRYFYTGYATSIESLKNITHTSFIHWHYCLYFLVFKKKLNFSYTSLSMIKSLLYVSQYKYNIHIQILQTGFWSSMNYRNKYISNMSWRI